MAFDFNKLYEGSNWGLATPFDRKDNLPIDSNSLFPSKALADAYATGVEATINTAIATYKASHADSKIEKLTNNSYVGQILTVIDNNVATVYVIEADRTLKAVGTAYNDNELRELIATKLDGVTGKEAIVATTTGNDVEVTLKLAQGDKAGNVTLSQDTNGLKADIDLSDYATKAELPTDFGVTSIITTDDNVVELTPITATDGAVTINGTHAKKGPTNGYTSGNTTTSVGTGTNSIQIPQLTVDEYGHVTAASDETISITIPAAPEYSIVKDETSTDYAAVYHLTKDGTNTGATINIPKDMMVQSGTVSEIPEVKYTAYPQGPGIVWQSDFFYVGGSPEDEPQGYDPVEGDKLVAGENSFGWTEATYKINDNDGHGYWYTSDGEIVTPEERDTLLVSGQTAGTYIVLTLANANNDKIYVNVGNLIEYVTSGSADTDMVVVSIDSDHKVTATITDGTITKAKLDTSIQTSLDNLIKDQHTHTNSDVLAGITAEKVSAWDSAIQKSDITELVADSHKHANKDVLDNLTQTVIDNSHSHTNSSVLAGITADLVSQWSAAEVNAINAVSSEFSIVTDTASSKDRVLEIAKIAASKVVVTPASGDIPEVTLDGALAGKVSRQYSSVTQEDGTTEQVEWTLLSPENQQKLAALVIGDGGSVEISGKVNASNVEELDTWIATNRDTVAGLFSSGAETKLAGIEAGAEVNVLEGIRLGSSNSDVLAILSDKTSVIPVATKDSLGIVKSVDIETETQEDGEIVITNAAAIENTISVKANGTMEVNRLNANRLVQTTGEWLILNGGNASLS